MRPSHHPSHDLWVWCECGADFSHEIFQAVFCPVFIKILVKGSSIRIVSAPVRESEGAWHGEFQLRSLIAAERTGRVGIGPVGDGNARIRKRIHGSVTATAARGVNIKSKSLAGNESERRNRRGDVNPSGVLCYGRSGGIRPTRAIRPNLPTTSIAARIRPSADPTGHSRSEINRPHPAVAGCSPIATGSNCHKIFAPFLAAIQ